MNAADLQQLVTGFKTVAVIGAPLMIRIHEALDSVYEGDASRYFISVDLKFRRNDALHIGTPGYSGLTKAEATRKANQLSSDLMSAHRSLEAAKSNPRNVCAATNAITIRRQEERFNKIAGQYTAEFVQ
jgi:hypothetical protein